MRRFLIAVLPLTLAAGSPPASSVPPKALPNPQLAAAGSMRDGVLSITLDAQMATWHPDGDSLPGIVVEAFGEPGAAPLAPGPLIRVPLGTAIHATVRNSLARDTLILHFHLGATPDSIVVPSGEQRELRTTPARATFWPSGSRKMRTCARGYGSARVRTVSSSPEQRREWIVPHRNSPTTRSSPKS